MKSLVIICLLFSVVCYAGNLNPSAPPTSGTMKTLNEVEPRIAINSENTPGDPNSTYIISQPGSYYLTENFTSNFKHGILIGADDVTLDLMGYRIYSSYVGIPSGSNLDFDGIHISSGLKNIRICNGSIVSNRAQSGMFFYNGFRYGIYSDGLSVGNISITDMIITCNRIDGIRLQGQNILAESCIVTDNDVSGIYLGNNSIVRKCQSSNNGYGSGEDVYGIRVGDSSIVKDSLSYKNGDSASGSKVYGISANGLSVVSGNNSFYNASSANSRIIGIIIGKGSVVKGNTSNRNGWNAQGYSIRGIDVSSGCTLVGNTSHDNGRSASSTYIYGISFSGGDCLVDENNSCFNGIEASGGSIVINMLTSYSNCVYGINYAP